MSAHAADLRHFYAETLGVTQEVALSGASARSGVLEPGRYIVRVRGLATGVRLWLRQGDVTISAATSAPSTPFELGGTVLDAASVRSLNEPLLSLIVRGPDAKDNHLAGILNAGTATLVLTKVSRDRG